MTQSTHGGDGPSPTRYARVAGVLYLIIIICGLVGEVFVRSRLIVSGDATATATNIAASQVLFRVGFLTDSIMMLSDVGLAVLLYVLFRPVSKVVSLAAMGFRLMQTAVLGVNLLNYHAAMLLGQGSVPSSAFGTDHAAGLILFFLDLHAHGYDLGLIFFGVHCLLLGYLIVKSHIMPRILGFLAGAAGLVYLIGSYTRFLLPEYLPAVSPIYLVAIVSEVALCLWLLTKGVDVTRWAKMNRGTTAEGTTRP